MGETSEFWATLIDALQHLRDPETADYFKMIFGNLSNEFSESMQKANEFFQRCGEAFAEFLPKFGEFLQKLLEMLSAA